MNILILTDKYYPKPLANAICIQKIADELQRLGCNTDILAYEDTGIKKVKKHNLMKVYYVRPDARIRLFYFARNFPESKYAKYADMLAKTMNRVKRLIYLPLYPMYSITLPIRIYKQLNRLNNKNNYDAVISVMAPFETALAGMMFKRKNHNSFWCMYVLDTFINLRYKFLNKISKNQIWISKFLKYSDLFLYMRSRKKEFDGIRFKKYKNKTIAVDIPLMVQVNNLKNSAETDEEHWIYAGSLGAPHYKTDDLVKIFLTLPQNKKRVLHFYSSGKEIEELKKLGSKTNGRIKAHNYVSHDELMQIYANAEVLVSMKYSDQISAKIFEYMSYGKKIVHISGTPNDPDAEYLSHYTKAIILTPYKDPIETCAKQFSEWLDSWTEEKERIPINYSYFEMNRPEYTANIILKQIKAKKQHG